MDTQLVPVKIPSDSNVIIGQTHFIKTAEDIYEAMVMIAFRYLMLLRIEGNPSGNKLPTLPQVRRELARIFIRRIYELKFNLSPEEADEFLEEYPVLIPE